ncbi:hypothetical protein ACGF0D_38985 [Kitasatospora sp. NPDC048298]|uniref:hypothetical protein n=1 Tax=Kitasatospora sp. NPDC048298 TaxID=3364049 RepID=UPI0037138C87
MADLVELLRRAEDVAPLDYVTDNDVADLAGVLSHTVLIQLTWESARSVMTMLRQSVRPRGGSVCSRGREPVARIVGTDPLIFRGKFWKGFGGVQSGIDPAEETTGEDRAEDLHLVQP